MLVTVSLQERRVEITSKSAVFLCKLYYVMSICCGSEFYRWFKILFKNLLPTLPYIISNHILTQRKINFEPRIKLNYNIYAWYLVIPLGSCLPHAAVSPIKGFFK